MFNSKKKFILALKSISSTAEKWKMTKGSKLGSRGIKIGKSNTVKTGFNASREHIKYIDQLIGKQLCQ